MKLICLPRVRNQLIVTEWRQTLGNFFQMMDWCHQASSAITRANVDKSVEITAAAVGAKWLNACIS